MKDIFEVLGLVLTWILIGATGPIIWETRTDVFQGIIFGLVLTIVIVIAFGKQGKQSEYDEYGNYRSKY